MSLTGAPHDVPADGITPLTLDLSFHLLPYVHVRNTW